MKLFAFVAASAIAMSVVSSAQAAVTFKLKGATFEDGSIVSGSFTTTDDFKSLTDYTLSTTEGSFLFMGFVFPTSGFDYSPTGTIGTLTPTYASFRESDDFGAKSLFINFGAGLSLGSTSVAGSENQYFTSRSFTGATLSTGGTSGSAVPEPTSWAMMIGGFGLIGGAMRRRSRRATNFQFA